MSTDGKPTSRTQRLRQWLTRRKGRGNAAPLTIMLAAIIGILGGYGAVAFSYLIHFATSTLIDPLVESGADDSRWLYLLAVVPAGGLLAAAWLSRTFAPEAEGHGVPEVITAVARRDGAIRPRVALIKSIASSLTIGSGGSVGREGPIVQIGSALGSAAGQWFRLNPQQVKVLVAAGAAAGISATFNAPLAGVIFASEIILASFAVQSLTPIVVASVLADVVQTHVGEHRMSAAFPNLDYAYEGAWSQLPSYVLLGLLCGVAAVSFTRLLYYTEDLAKAWLPKWWVRALVLGGLVGAIGVALNGPPPNQSRDEASRHWSPALLGVGYNAVDHALHLQRVDKQPSTETSRDVGDVRKGVVLDRAAMWRELWWILPLALLKPLMTSVTLAGGGSGGVFAPSLFIGATTGAAFGLVSNLIAPEWSASPGVYAIVGMGAVVSGTTHGVLSAILIVYEMTDDYQLILPIMAAAGLSSLVAHFIDPQSIYYKKLSRRGESIQRGHDMHCLEHIMVRDVMIREFPLVKHSDTVREIIRVASTHTHIESLPVMDAEGDLIGIIGAEDLHRVVDTDMEPSLVNADDIASPVPVSVAPDANLLEALREFGSRDLETLPVVARHAGGARLVGLLLRSDVIRRYRVELLRNTG